MQKFPKLCQPPPFTPTVLFRIGPLSRFGRAPNYSTLNMNPLDHFIRRVQWNQCVQSVQENRRRLESQWLLSLQSNQRNRLVPETQQDRGDLQHEQTFGDQHVKRPRTLMLPEQQNSRRSDENTHRRVPTVRSLQVAL